MSSMQTKRLARVLLSALLVNALCCALFAQAVSQISGTVKDSSGAVVAGAEVTASQTETGF